MTLAPEYTKKSITIPTPLYQQAAEFAGEGSFSAYTSAALARQVERDHIAQLVAEMEAVHGPADPADVARRARELA
jgi:hypothetical protein